jgi:release factor glutamine methyltransferase
MIKTEPSLRLRAADVKFIYEKILGLDYSRYLLGDKPLTLSQQKKWQKVITIYGQGIPLEYIAGKSSFFGFDFEINRQVLIPRPETELLVEEVLNLTSPSQELKVLDVGTGSGNIGITLGLLREKYKIYACDICFEALFLATKNCKKHKLKNVFFIRTDLASGFKPGFFDVIVANLPYVKTSYIDKCRGLRFEPRKALDGGRQGLKFIKRILSSGSDLLRDRGLIFLEIGFDQKDEVLACIEKNSLRLEYVKKDYNNIDRIVVCSYLKDKNNKDNSWKS